MIMIVASLFPWVAVYLTVSPGNSLGIDYFPLFSSLSGLFYVVGIFQYKLFQIVPIATDMVFRHSKEGIMLIDQSDRIIEANLFMTKMYPELRDLKQRIGFASFTEAHPELSDFVAGERTAQYELMNEGSERHYLAHMTLIKAEGDLAVGKMLTISEITQFMEQQKQLESIASHALNKAETNEISFLQAQIKPHFLNNTLSVISSMITSDPGKAKALIADLGEYLVRSCYFDSSTDMVLLQEELETVNIYVAIQCARFGPRIVFELDCPHTPNMLIPRLVLQPLVENAIRHGILKKAQGGKVTLRIITDSGSVSFVVIDDGIGISADKAALLMAQHSRQDGVGLPNIHKRLIKHYGEGLQIDSMLGSGTKVFFRIPYQKVMHEEAEHGQRNRCG
jgi:two-component system LytT family sensor kinase